MIAYISGKIIWANREIVLIEASGIGYEINYRNSISRREYGSIKSLFLSHKISEFGEVLYGFASLDEKMIFESLSSIKGIGPKVIFQIMHDLKIRTISDLSKITLENLLEVDGVGKTTAQKFLLGLSTKFKKEFGIAKVTSNEFRNIEAKFEDSINVLVEWGVKRKNIVEFLNKNYDVVANLKTEKVIEYVLKNMNMK